MTSPISAEKNRADQLVVCEDREKGHIEPHMNTCTEYMYMYIIYTKHMVKTGKA